MREMKMGTNLLYDSFVPMDYSKLSQLLEINFFKDKKDGFFIEVGAHDGLGGSCTKRFEDSGWRGICIEPNPEIFETLRKNRAALCINCGISTKNTKSKFLKISGTGPSCLSGLISQYDPRHVKRIHNELAQDGGTTEIIDVDCRRLDDVVGEHRISRIDLLSIDTEGGELEILKTINYHRLFIDVIVVENNYKESKLPGFLISKGYCFVLRSGPDEIFKKVQIP